MWGGTRAVAVGAGTVVSAALVCGLVSPVWAASPEHGGSEVELGSFSLGDALESTIGELDGSFGFALSAGGVQLAWDSRSAGSDPAGLGGGWSFGLTKLRVTGGIWITPPSGGAYPFDATASTGLAGYPRTDVRFEALSPGDTVVPARDDGAVEDREAAFVLHALGGVSTYFDPAGHPITKLSLDGERIDWRWEPGTGRLHSVVTSDGSITTLDWSDPARLVITPGSNVTDPMDGSGVGGRWQVEFDGKRVAAVSDPVGGRTRIAYDGAGLVQRVSAPSGASTTVRWRAATDGVARVDTVRVVDDATGAELGVRHWGAAGEVTPSGWPLFDAAAGAAGPFSGDGAAPFDTWVSDGKTQVTSTVDGFGRVTDRGVMVTSSSGERLVQSQEFEYAPLEGAPGTPAAPLPTTATTTYRNEHGGTRSTTETYDFDRFGRMVRRTTADGTDVRSVFDDVVQPGRALPVGHLLETTKTAPDGSVTSTRSELSDDRTAIVATEHWSGHAGAELARTERVESTVDHGLVVEERVFPGGDPAAEPMVTRWSEAVDLRRGTSTVTRTSAAGSAMESSTSSVSSIVHGATLSETDALGNRSSARYDEAGRRIALAAAGRAVTHEYATRQTDGTNAMTTRDAATGVAVTETRDVLGRLTKKADNIAPSGHAEAGYERVIETHEFGTPGVERVTDAWGAVTTTEQDVFGRTERVTLPNGVVQLAEFDDVAGTATSGLSTTGDLADAEVTTSALLDTSGRVIGTSGSRADGMEVPATTTEYDGFGREVTHTTAEGERISIAYWADGHRRERATDTAATRYYWDGERLLNEAHERADGEQGTASYLVGTHRLARSVHPADGHARTTYYGADRHGNITDLTDENGSVTARYGYTDYGVPSARGAGTESTMPGGVGDLGYNPFQYAGEYTYPDGTQPLGPRLYDPVQARFTSEDDAPLGNLYAFGDLNPITNVDPTGRNKETDHQHTFASAVAFVAALVGGLLLLTTPGPLFTVSGILGIAISVADAVLAAVQALESQFGLDLHDDGAFDAASWALLGASVAIGFAGATVKWATRGGSKAATACFELMDCANGGLRRLASGVERTLVKNPTPTLDAFGMHQQIRRWDTWLAAADVDGITSAVANVADAEVKSSVASAVKHLQFAKALAAKEAKVARDFSSGVAAQTHRALKAVYKSLVYDLKAARAYLGIAESRLIAPAQSGLAGTEAARDALPSVQRMYKEIDALFRPPTPVKSPVRTPENSPLLPRSGADPEESPLLLRNADF